MRKQQIIAIVIVLALLGGAGAGYQFYFKPTLEKFAEDKQYLDQLDAKLNVLKKTFPAGTKPQEAVETAKAKIQPWEEALEQRAKVFSIRDFRKIEELPETKVLKAYYAQASQKMVDELRNEVYVKQVYLNPSIDLFFGMPTPGSLSQKSVHQLEAIYWLTNIKYGTSVIRMLVDNEALGIDNFYVWPPRTTGPFTTYAVGASVWMTMQGFCKFLENAQSNETMCISVQGFHIQNTQLRSYVDPPLKIDFVFKMDTYDYQPKGSGGDGKGNAATGKPAAGAASAPPGVTDETLAKMQSMRSLNLGNRGSKEEEKKKSQSFWQKLWPF